MTSAKQFGKYTVPELKSFVLSRGQVVPLKTNKATLANMVRTLCGVATVKSEGERGNNDDDDDDDDDDGNDGGDAGAVAGGEGDDDDDARAKRAKVEKSRSTTSADGFDLPPPPPVKSASTSMSKHELPLCKYGAACYRKNDLHLSTFRHE
jgi:hypothetical protein